MPLSSVDKVRRQNAASTEYTRASRPAGGSAAAPSADERQRTDSVEISDAARRLNESGAAANLDNVRGRIRNGFYNRPEVARHVAAKLAKDVRNPENDNG